MSRRILISLVLVAWQPVPRGEKLFACGGAYTPDCILGSDDQLLRSPQAEFLVELHRALPKIEARFKAQLTPVGRETELMTQNSGYADLRAAMVTAHIPKARREEILKGYLSVREYLRSYHNRSASHRDRLRWMSETKRKQAKAPKFESPKMPAALPREFDLYLRGAIAWRTGDVKGARRQWQAVLVLPVEQRKHRSVWAAYMLGRSYVGRDSKRAVKWFRLTRDLAAGNFTDSTGLAAASLGWQGRAELDRGDRLAAIKLYVEQLGAGGGFAAPSLRICASALLKAGEKELDRAARNESARGVLTAHLVAGASPHWIASSATGKKQVQAWLEALETAGVRKLPGAGRLGWAAYRTGLMRQAQRWVDRAPKHDVIACWIRAKLLLRAGKIDEAAGQLAAALKASVPLKQAGENERLHTVYFARSLAEDLASLRVNRRQYAEALDLLTTHAHHDASAYLVERVLTLDELIAYVGARAKDARIQPVRDGLARRLVRAGRWKDARGYFSPEMRKELNDYIAAIRKGHDSKTGRTQRAEAFWAAARAARKWGRQLMGYDTGWYGAEPDGTFHPWREFSRVSAGDGFTVAPASKDERRRVGLQRPRPVEHWHHLYEAVAHAWRACKLMPDNDEKTARRLCEAGTWIKYLDPQAANPFYKALVLRCGDTGLGKEAARLHWLPKIVLDSKK